MARAEARQPWKARALLLLGPSVCSLGGLESQLQKAGRTAGHAAPFIQQTMSQTDNVSGGNKDLRGIPGAQESQTDQTRPGMGEVCTLPRGNGLEAEEATPSDLGFGRSHSESRMQRLGPEL